MSIWTARYFHRPFYRPSWTHAQCRDRNFQARFPLQKLLYYKCVDTVLGLVVPVAVAGSTLEQCPLKPGVKRRLALSNSGQNDVTNMTDGSPI